MKERQLIFLVLHLYIIGAGIVFESGGFLAIMAGVWLLAYLLTLTKWGKDD